MRKVIVLSLLFVVGCQTVSITTKEVVPVNGDLAIRRAAVFLFIMRNDGTWGEKELAAEIEYLGYLLELDEEPDG